MQRSDIKILIIEDDPTHGKALEEGFKRAGYNVYLVKDYSQAQALIKINDFHGMIVDCMLPQKNGIDTTLDLQKEFSQDVATVLMSGIFKDKSYAVEAQAKTKALAFFNKPFDLQDAIKTFDNAFENIIDQNASPLFNLLLKTSQSAKEKISAINNTEYIHGYDLPLIYNILSEANISGELHIQYEDDKKSVVGFNNGFIDLVNHADTDSYFGVLLIEKGFVSSEELETNLNKKDNKKIGERLVDSSSLSPHAIDVIQYEQMIIRLSKTIVNASVVVKFIAGDKKTPNVYIDQFAITHLTSDWIHSKIDNEWILGFYNQWLNTPLQKGLAYNKLPQTRDLVASNDIYETIKNFSFNQTLGDILENQKSKDEDFLKGIHFYLLQNIVVFAQKENSQQNFENKISRFKKILASFDGKSHFDILAVSKNAREQEINRSYHDLAKSLHPDKLSPNSPDELKELAKKVFSKITTAYQTLSHSEKKEAYLKSIEVGLAEEILKAEASFEEGLRHIKVNHFRDARKTFQKTMKLKGHRSDTIVYLAWAYIKEKRKQIDPEQLGSEIKSLIGQVAHEDRHSVQYFFVKGMYHELTGQVEKAYSSFKHCIKLNPGFLDAKREMAYIHQKYGAKKTSILTEDLSTVVTKLFKRKTG